MSRNASLGYAGSYLDIITGGYPLGNGYRWYMPVLMRFNAPDSLSPFGLGGINPYTYCAGDPINYSDPSGHVNPAEALKELVRVDEDEAEDWDVDIEGDRDAVPLGWRSKADQPNDVGLVMHSTGPGTSAAVKEPERMPLPLEGPAGAPSRKRPRPTGTGGVPGEPPEGAGNRKGSRTGWVLKKQLITYANKEASGEDAHILVRDYVRREGVFPGKFEQLREVAFLQKLAGGRIATHVSQLKGFTTLEDLALELGLPPDRYTELATEKHLIEEGMMDPRPDPWTNPDTGWQTVYALIWKHVLPR